MEAVAAASSIAGLVSLVGQALDGIMKLRAFFKSCTIASKTVDRFLRDLNSLIQTLEEVKNIVARLENVPASTFDNEAMISSLQYQLEGCSKDIYDWVQIASEQHSKFSNGSKAVFKRFMVAVNKESYADILREIGSHRDGLMLKLSLIGRYALPIVAGVMTFAIIALTDIVTDLLKSSTRRLYRLSVGNSKM